MKQKTKDTTQYKIVIIYIFKKKKKQLTFGSSPCRKRGELEGTGLAPMQAASQVRAAEQSGLGFLRTALITKFPFLALLFALFFF